MTDIFDKLNAAYGDHILADSDQIKDKHFNKKQEDLNKEILDDTDPTSIKSKVDSFNGIIIDPDNAVSAEKSDIEVGSSKIPTGNAVAGALSDAVLKAGVFDISAYNLTEGQPTPYVDITAALGNSGENVPVAVRKGGMQVKFIQGSVGSSDNKYVQYRYMGTETTGSPNPFLDTANWQGVDDESKFGSKNLIDSSAVYDEIDKLSGGNVYRDLIPNKTYDDSNGEIINYTNRCCTSRMKFILNPKCNAFDYSQTTNCAYFFSDDVYLGWSKTSYNEPTTWIASDHTSPITHIAFSWNDMSVVDKVYYFTDAVFASKKELDDLDAELSEETDERKKGDRRTISLIYRGNKDGEIDNFLHTGWSYSQGKYINSAYGISNRLRLNKSIGIDPRVLVLDINPASGSVVYFGNEREIEGSGVNADGNSLWAIDFANGSLKYYGWFFISQIPATALKSVSFDNTNYASRTFRILLFYKDRKINVQLVDATTNIVLSSLDYKQQLNNKCPFVGYDKYFIYSETASVSVSRFDIFTKQYNECKALILGDSITYGQGCPNSVNDVWSYRLAQALGNSFVSGVSGITINSVIDRVSTELISQQPLYTIVCIGANGGNTQTNLNQLISLIKQNNSIPILCTTPQLHSNKGLSNVNSDIISVAQSNDVSVVRFDIATCLDYDLTKGRDTSIYADTVHPNPAGNLRMYDRLFIDVPELLYVIEKSQTEILQEEIDEIKRNAETINENQKSGNIYRELLSNYTYNDSNGDLITYSGYYATNKIPFIVDANTNMMSMITGEEVQVKETLYYHDSTYLGYTKNDIYKPLPDHWASGVDHTLSVTHVAFTWVPVTGYTIENVYYTREAQGVSKSYVDGLYEDSIDAIQTNTQQLNAQIASVESSMASASDLAGMESSISTQNATISAQNDAITGIENDIDTINNTLSDLTSPLPSGAIAGNNVWTGANQFSQRIVGVSAQNDNELTTLGQLHSASASNRFENAKDYGLLPTNSASDNVTALNNALNGGSKTLVVSVPGTYKLNASVYLYDNTTLICGDGVIFQKDANYNNMFVNHGASTRTKNKNITIIGLYIDVNSKTGQTFSDSSSTLGLRGELSFLCVENVNVYNYKAVNLGSFCYGIQVNQAYRFILDGFDISGNKDAVHISAIDTFVIRNGICQTYDDALALNSSDWITSNCVNGDIKNGLIENVTDKLLNPTSGFMCRLLTGAWVDWHEGISIRRGDTVVNNGRIYRAYIADLDNNSYTSETEPTITTFSGSQADACGGFSWKLMRDDTVYYSTNIYNVTFRHINGLSKRYAFAEEVDIDGSYNRSLHPDVLPANYPKVHVKIEDSYLADNEHDCYNSVARCNTWVLANNLSGPGMVFRMASPHRNIMYKKLYVRYIDFLAAAGKTNLILGEGTVTDLYECLYTQIKKSGLGVLNTDCEITSV